MCTGCKIYLCFGFGWFFRFGRVAAAAVVVAGVAGVVVVVVFGVINWCNKSSRFGRIVCCSS